MPECMPLILVRKIPMSDLLLSQPLLRVELDSVCYGTTQVLSDIVFELHAGVALAILGSNGAGKSTLARALAGLVPVSSGRVIFDQVDITTWPAHRIRQRGFTYLPEDRGIFRTLSVTDNIRMAVRWVGGRRERAAALAAALSSSPFSMSGETSQQQACPEENSRCCR